MVFRIPALPRPLENLLKRLEEDDAVGITAQTSFFVLLSLFPLIILILNVLGRFNVYLELSDLEYVLPSQLANLLELAPTKRPNAGSVVLSLGVSLWSASRGIWALMQGVHLAFNGKRLKFTVRTQALTLVFTLAFVSSLTITLVLWLLTSDLAAELLMLRSTPLGDVFRFAGSTAVIYMFILALYIFTPDCQKWRKKAPLGACAATAVWMVGNVVFEAVSGLIFQDNPLYSGTSAFLAIAIWIFVVGAGIVLGAEINAVSNI